MMIGWPYTPQGCMAPARRGEAQGGFQRSALKPLLWGEPPAFGGVGGTLPPRLSPGGGNGKGGDQTSLLPQASARALPWMPPSRALPRKSLWPLKSRNSQLGKRPGKNGPRIQNLEALKPL